MKLNIRTKLFGGFSILLVLLVAIGIVSYIDLGQLNTQMSAMYDDSTVPLQQLGHIDAYLYKIRGDVYKYELIRQQRAETEITLNTTKETINAELAKYHTSQLSAADEEALTTMENAITLYFAEVDKCVSLIKADQEPEMMALIADGGSTSNARKAADAAITNLMEINVAEAASLDQAGDRAFASSSLIIICVAVFAALAAIGIAFFLTQSITGAINRVKKALRKMATGNLTEKVNITSRDEIGEMVNSYNETRNYLNNLVTQFKENAVQLAAASAQLSTAATQSSEATQQVATSSQQMAKGAQEQSTNAQETSKSISQLSEVINQLSKGAVEQSSNVQKAVAAITGVANTITEVSQNANQAAQGAKQAADSAGSGSEKAKLNLKGIVKIRDAASNVSTKIDELGTLSKEIGKIVAVIDDIAAQTNLLALNAAIEAARAGEQGRGFAVVSDEVRKLAERSGTATKEIADLIVRVQKGVTEATEEMAVGKTAVAEGYEMAVQTGKSLEQILKASGDVNAQVEQISIKTQQVNQATNELVKLIDGVGSITEENTAAAEQMTANATQVMKSVETVAGIAEENSAATEQVSASAQEMSAQVEEIVASSQTLKEMALSLEKGVAMFKVDATVVEASEE
jgi:methyl-accepting chemotaxis protein